MPWLRACSTGFVDGRAHTLLGTYNGAFRHGLTISPINGLYEITWSSGGATIGTASVTRSC